jgi:hypothetical protein
MTKQTAIPSWFGMSPLPGATAGLGPFAAPRAVGVALMLAVMTLLIFITVTHNPAPAATGNRLGAPIVVPHPAPGPFGS